MTVLFAVLLLFATALGPLCVLSAVRGSRSRLTERAEAVVESGCTDLGTLGLLCGGPVRAIDTRIVGLIERGHVKAQAAKGVLGRPECRFDLAPERPPKAGERPRPAETTFTDRVVLDAVADTDGDLDALRRRLAAWWGRSDGSWLREHRLIFHLTPAMVLLVVLSFAPPLSVGLFGHELNEPAGSGDAWGVAGIVAGIASAVASIVLLSVVMNRRWADPLTPRGHQVRRLLDRGLGPNGGQAYLVATGGFAAMTDERLRGLLQPWTIDDSKWTRPQSLGSGGADVNAALAFESGFDFVADGDGGGGGGGDGGDGGGGGD